LKAVQKLNEYFDKDLLKHAHFLHTVTLSLRTRFSNTMAEHCWVGGIIDGALVIVTDSANWVIPIRYQQHELLKQLNCEFRNELLQQLKRIKIKVSLPPHTPMARRTQLALSIPNARILASTASGINDPDLRAVLLRLSKRAKPSR
jgi:hypothetical protein